MGFPAGFAEFAHDGLSSADDPATMGIVKTQTRLPRPPCQVAQSCGVQKRRLHGMEDLAANPAPDAP